MDSDNVTRMDGCSIQAGAVSGRSGAMGRPVYARQQVQTLEWCLGGTLGTSHVW